MKFPEGFIDSIKKASGFDETAFIKAHEDINPSTSIRLNPFKTNSLFESNEKIKWCEQGRYLKERPVFTNDPSFHAGSYYVQEASSMFISHLVKNVVNLSAPLRILDLCAAPGGKSTLLASLINENSILLANEIIKSRAGILAENISKWGTNNVVVSNSDPKQIGELKNHFDLILVDAPCSGSGLFRKDKSAMNEWSPENVELCKQRQQRILTDIFPALKENGILIYTTCSYSEEENEFIADWLMDKFMMKNVSVAIEKDWGISISYSEKYKAMGYRFYPDKIKGEGFYATCMIKTSDNLIRVSSKSKSHLDQLSNKEISTVSPWVKNADEMFFYKQNNQVCMIHKCHENNLLEYQNRLYLKKAGTRIGKISGNDFIPDHELALSNFISPELSKIELTKEESLLYLKKLNFTLSNVDMGWQLMSYMNVNLGWAKILQNRINNYYPTDWRILRDIKEKE